MQLLELARSYYPSVGGAEKFVHDRTKVYETLGVSWSLMTTDFSTEKTDAALRIPHVTVLRQYTPYNIVPRLRSYLTDDYDLISVNHIGRYYSDFAINHYRHRRQRILLTPYYSYHTDRYEFIKRFIQRMFIPSLLKGIDALIVFSEHEKDFWESEFHGASAFTHVIPPYVTLDSTVTSPSTSPDAQPYILYLGRAFSNKKTDLLLESFMSIPDVRHHLYLTIRQEDISPRLLPAVLKDSRIKLLGFVNEAKKHELLHNTDALIFPSSWESFGYVAFEAALHKKPLLCSSIPVLRELLDPAGTVFFDNTIEGISDAISFFTGFSMERKKSMGTINHARASKYNFTLAAQKYKILFGLLL